MKTLPLRNAAIALLVPAMTSCAATILAGAPNANELSGVIDAEDERSLGGRAVLGAYAANDPRAMGEWIADDAKVVFNTETVDKAIFLANVSERHGQFEVSLVNPIVTTMIYNDGKAYTNLWTTWKGVARSTGEEVKSPAQMFMTWRDGRISTFMHHFDPGPLDRAIESL